MEWITHLNGKTIGLDTAPLIYFIEENPRYTKQLNVFFEGMDKGEYTVVTSMITLLEVLVHPLRKAQPVLASEYRSILLNSRLVTMETTAAIAETAAGLRARYGIRTPDAIQLATSITAGASLFFTNDVRLPEMEEVKIISLDRVSL